eukprot:1382654-Alexandrium_andersonii.AAC.1
MRRLRRAAGGRRARAAPIGPTMARRLLRARPRALALLGGRLPAPAPLTAPRGGRRTSGQPARAGRRVGRSSATCPWAS